MKNKIMMMLAAITVVVISAILVVGCSTLNKDVRKSINITPDSVSVESTTSRDRDNANSQNNITFNPILLAKDNSAYPCKMTWTKDAKGKWKITKIDK